MTLRYEDIKTKSNRILDLTSLTVDEFEQLAIPFEAAFVRHMTEWTMEGKRRSARAYSPYANSPLPTPEDRLLFILSYLKVAALQVAHGTMFGLSQSNANKWIHLLLVVLQQTLYELGDAPARHLADLQQQLASVQPSSGSLPPLFITTEPNVPSRAPTILMSKMRCIARQKKTKDAKRRGGQIPWRSASLAIGQRRPQRSRGRPIPRECSGGARRCSCALFAS